MSLWTQPRSTPFWQERSAFLTALVLAGLLHAVLLLGISFSPEPQTHNRLIAITLNHPNPAIIAQESQIPTQTETITPAKIKPEQAVESKSHPKTLNTAHRLSSPEIEAAKPVLNAESLQQQISQLGERIRTNQPANNQKVKYASSVSNHRYLAAQYVQDWENKVERTGNLNYPEAARHKREAQILTMDVGINPDGSIYSMRITRSSGNLELDEAAKRIVRMSAPFAELPADLLQEVNVLVITRVWKFSDETGMTSH